MQQGIHTYSLHRSIQAFLKLDESQTLMPLLLG